MRCWMACWLAEMIILTLLKISEDLLPNSVKVGLNVIICTLHCLVISAYRFFIMLCCVAIKIPCY